MKLWFRKTQKFQCRIFQSNLSNLLSYLALTRQCSKKPNLPQDQSTGNWFSVHQLPQVRQRKIRSNFFNHHNLLWFVVDLQHGLFEF
ncbi:MAG: hypothetical protein AAGJ08_13360 [Cyanobacteria bacterium P01_H01_bin.35]